MSTTSSTPMPATGSLQLVEAFVERLDGAPVGERRRWSEVQGAGCHSGAGAWHQCFRAGPQLFGWRKAFLNKQKEDVPPGAPVPLVEIVVGDVLIRVAPDLGEAALRRLISAVRSA